eukprot:SAG11_NODE_25908_length_352_cov_0.924901_1_plen_94_part_10
MRICVRIVRMIVMDIRSSLCERRLHTCSNTCRRAVRRAAAAAAIRAQVAHRGLESPLLTTVRLADSGVVCGGGATGDQGNAAGAAGGRRCRRLH